jgi:hypothetical protein
MADLTPPEPTHPIRADAQQRADRAWQARVVGASWAQAAEVAGFADDATAVHAVRNAYGRLPEPDRTELRRLWRDRLETLWKESLRDVTERRGGAVTASVRVAGLAVALDGLAAPLQVDVEVTQTFAALTAELLSNDLLPSHG